MKLVPFHHYKRVDGSQVLFDNCQALFGGMAFVAIPFEGDLADAAKVAAALIKHDSDRFDEGYRARLTAEICGYAVIDDHILEILEKTAGYSAGSDSASDAIACFKTAVCVGNAKWVKNFKYELDDYRAKTSEYVETPPKPPVFRNCWTPPIHDKISNDGS